MRSYLEEGVKPRLLLLAPDDGLLAHLKEVDKGRVGLDQLPGLGVERGGVVGCQHHLPLIELLTCYFTFAFHQTAQSIIAPQLITDSCKLWADGGVNRFLPHGGGALFTSGPAFNKSRRSALTFFQQPSGQISHGLPMTWAGRRRRGVGCGGSKYLCCDHTHVFEDDVADAALLRPVRQQLLQVPLVDMDGRAHTHKHKQMSTGPSPPWWS